MIIFVGPNGTGKTTLAKTVSKFTGIPVLRQMRPNDIVNKSKLANSIWPLIGVCQTQTTLDILEAIKIPVIFDRFHIDEIVYSELFDRPCDIAFYREVDLRLTRLGAKIIYVVADFEIIKNRRPIKQEEYLSLLELYSQYVCWTMIPWIKIDGGGDIHKNAKSIIDFCIA